MAERTKPVAAIVYDGQCPFCSRYVELVRLRESLGKVELIDARDGGPLVGAILVAGLDLDDGMVLKLDGRLYHGAECLHMLARAQHALGLVQSDQRGRVPLPHRNQAAVSCPAGGA
jgi:predicted DCC family thiol-disulfide oxidoreductase YuxK